MKKTLMSLAALLILTMGTAFAATKDCCPDCPPDCTHCHGQQHK